MNKVTIDALHAGYRLCLEATDAYPEDTVKDIVEKPTRWVWNNYSTYEAAAKSMGVFHYVSLRDGGRDNTDLMYSLRAMRPIGNDGEKEIYIYMQPIFDGSRITLVAKITDECIDGRKDWSFPDIPGNDIRSLSFDVSNIRMADSMSKDEWVTILEQVEKAAMVPSDNDVVPETVWAKIDCPEKQYIKNLKDHFDSFYARYEADLNGTNSNAVASDARELETICSQMTKCFHKLVDCEPFKTVGNRK